MFRQFLLVYSFMGEEYLVGVALPSLYIRRLCSFSKPRLLISGHHSLKHKLLFFFLKAVVKFAKALSSFFFLLTISSYSPFIPSGFTFLLAEEHNVEGL